MNLLKASDFQSILRVSLILNECESSVALVELIENTLMFHFNFKAKIHWVKAPEASGNIPVKGSVPARTIIRSRVYNDHYQISLTANNGSTLIIRIENRSSGFSDKDCELMDELSVHLAGAHEQVSRIEALNKTLASIRNQSAISQAKSKSVTHSLPFDQLTPRERQAVDLLGQGLSNPAIADKMKISRRTVEKHFESAYRKLGLENRYQLIKELAG